MRSGIAHGRRFFRSTLQPIAEHLEYNPCAVAYRYRSNYLGSVSLPTQQPQASFSSGPAEKPKRDTASPEELPGQSLDPNTVPPKGAQHGVSSGKVSKGHDAPSREELEGGDSGKETASSGPAGPSGRPSDSHVTYKEGTQRNARPGEFAPNDPKAPNNNIPEESRSKSGQ